MNPRSASFVPGCPKNRVACLLVLAFCLVLVAAAPALAFNTTGALNESGGALTCSDCHDGDYSRGPHAGYRSTSSKCDACHSVHDGPASSAMLLPSLTIRGTCEVCHDGTGGTGVYGALSARNVPVSARHRIDVTNTVPGGDSSTGGSAVRTFTGQSNRLSCDDCHSPHGASVVASFTGDRARTATDTALFFSSRLLRQKPVSSATTVSVYGSDWCGGCHSGRISASSAVHNHPVDSLNFTASPFYYENVAVLTTETVTSTVVPRSLGRTNRGYYMPMPRTAEQGTHKPICQQCHEDLRSVEHTPSPPYVDYFTVSAADGGGSGDNPQFQVFPHEGQNPGFLVETGEDLCTNCHQSGRTWQ